MKKKNFLLTALCATMSVANGFAQDASEKLKLYWPLATSSLWVSAEEIHAVENGIDGDEKTRWGAGWEKTDNDANYPQGRYWYRACFGDDAVDFNTIRVCWYGNTVKTFQILTSDNYDTDFKVVYTSEEGREHTGWQTYNVGNQHGKSFRIQATEFSTEDDPRFSFYEIEAYNVAASTGISSVEEANKQHTANVYSLDGTLVKQNAASLDGLPCGIYIVNGKKHVVK